MNRGAVLILTMVFALLLTIVAATVMRTAALQFHMTGNEQFQEEAFQMARSIATELALNRNNFDSTGSVDRSNCTADDTSAMCERHTLQTPRSAATAIPVDVEYRVTRRAPELMMYFPIRETQAGASSHRYASAAIFEVDVKVDGSERRLGSAHLVRGVAMRLGARP